MLTTDPLNSGLTQLTRFGAGNACDTPCAGDARITCGGQQQASVYLENDATPAVPPNEYTPVGCYKYVAWVTLSGSNSAESGTAHHVAAATSWQLQCYCSKLHC
jgi:hypothetical protein